MICQGFKFHGNTVIKMNEIERNILPMNLQKGLFSTASIDNADVETKSWTAFISLHGKAASVNQYVADAFSEEPESQITLSKATPLRTLSSFYTDVPPS